MPIYPLENFVSVFVVAFLVFAYVISEMNLRHPVHVPLIRRDNRRADMRTEVPRHLPMYFPDMERTPHLERRGSSSMENSWFVTFGFLITSRICV